MWVGVRHGGRRVGGRRVRRVGGVRDGRTVVDWGGVTVVHHRMQRGGEETELKSYKDWAVQKQLEREKPRSRTPTSKTTPKPRKTTLRAAEEALTPSLEAPASAGPQGYPDDAGAPVASPLAEAGSMHYTKRCTQCWFRGGLKPEFS